VKETTCPVDWDAVIDSLIAGPPRDVRRRMKRRRVLLNPNHAFRAQWKDGQC